MEEKRLWRDCVVVACFWCPEINFLKLLHCSCKIVVLNLANGEDMHCSVVTRHTQQRAVAVEVHAVNSRGLKIKYYTICCKNIWRHVGHLRAPTELRDDVAGRGVEHPDESALGTGGGHLRSLRQADQLVTSIVAS